MRADGGVGGGAVVRLQPQALQRRLVPEPVHVHHAAKRLRDQIGAAEVAVRSGLPERRDGNERQARVARSERGIAEAECVEPAGRTGFDDDVGGGREAQKPRAILRRFEIERHAALVGVVVPEEERAVWVRARRRRRPGVRRTARCVASRHRRAARP